MTDLAIWLDEIVRSVHRVTHACFGVPCETNGGQIGIVGEVKLVHR